VPKVSEDMMLQVEAWLREAAVPNWE